MLFVLYCIIVGVLGGERHGDKGYYIQPTIFTDVTVPGERGLRGVTRIHIHKHVSIYKTKAKERACI